MHGGPSSGTRAGGERLDRAAERGAPGGHQRHLVGEAAQLVEPLRGPEDRRAALGRAVGDQLAHGGGGLGVEVVRGLVDQQHRRLGEQRAGDREPLLHAVRPAADGVVAAVGQADVGEHGAGTRVGGLLAHPVQAGEEREVLDAGDALVGRAVARRARGRPSRAAPRGPLAASMPTTRTVPAVGSTRPASVRSSVVLPAPFGPSSAWISPGAHREVDAGDRDPLTEAALQAAHVDRRSTVTSHEADDRRAGAGDALRKFRYGGDGLASLGPCRCLRPGRCSLALLLVRLVVRRGRFRGRCARTATTTRSSTASSLGGSGAAPVLVALREPADAPRGSRDDRGATSATSPATTRLRLVHAFAARATPAQIRALAARPDVDHVEDDAVGVPFGVAAQASFGVTRASEDLPERRRPRPRRRGHRLRDRPDDGRPRGRARSSASRTSSTGAPTPYDDLGHGSLVAGILAGSGASGPEGRGVAPGRLAGERQGHRRERRRAAWG